MVRFNIVPTPKPRMTQGDRWGEVRPPVARYWAFKDELQRQARGQDFELGECLMMIFYLPMPQSWSKKERQRMSGLPHKQTPDVDNLCKGVMDSLLPSGDGNVWFITAAKFWAIEGAIEITNLEPYEAQYILVRKDMTLLPKTNEIAYIVLEILSERKL